MINELKRIKQEQLEKDFANSVEIEHKKLKWYKVPVSVLKWLKMAILGITGRNTRLTTRTKLLNILANMVIVIIFVFVFYFLTSLTAISSVPTTRSEAGKLASIENCMAFLETNGYSVK